MALSSGLDIAVARRPSGRLGPPPRLDRLILTNLVLPGTQL
jgi:hypothetical protein